MDSDDLVFSTDSIGLRSQDLGSNFPFLIVPDRWYAVIGPLLRN